MFLRSDKTEQIILLNIESLILTTYFPGTYFMSMVVLMRMNMPEEYRAIVTEVLGDLQFNFYHRWFDVMFLVAATCTMAVLYLAHKRDKGEQAYKDE